jgi:hypothetical protein
LSPEHLLLHQQGPFAAGQRNIEEPAILRTYEVDVVPSQTNWRFLGEGGELIIVGGVYITLRDQLWGYLNIRA